MLPTRREPVPGKPHPAHQRSTCSPGAQVRSLTNDLAGHGSVPAIMRAS